MTPLPPVLLRPAPPVEPAPQPPTTGAPSRRDRVRRWWLADRRRRIVLVVLLVLALLAGAGLWWVRRPPGPAPLNSADVREVATAVASRAVEQAQQAPAEGRAVYAAIAPSLVVVRTGAPGAATGGLGAGVIANAKGEVLTAHHVVAGGEPITLTWADGTTSRAHVRLAQPERDLAVLIPDSPPEVIVPATLASGVRTGDRVYAVGHPLGLAGSLSAGVVSATGRTLAAKDGVTLSDLIQFDAAVNPGNSGGPLLDRGGRVVGVVTALANPSDQPHFIGIGFAVPISQAGGAVGAPAL